MPQHSRDDQIAKGLPAAGGEALLSTKLFVPRFRARQVGRPRLIEKLNGGHDKALILVSAPAGFGKTTAVAEWIASCNQPAAWLSLDEGDNDPTRFLTYFIAALQTIRPSIGEGVLQALQEAQPPSTEAVLTSLVNEIAALSEHFTLVLDDYHVVDDQSVDEALGFLLEHMPAQMQLVIATREDPRLPLARLRARGQLIELRATDLRFSPSEAAEFLNQEMGLDLSTEDITALEARTEGWIAGLQLAAISMQGSRDAATFLKSFTGSHHFVMDYLVEEVLQQQAEGVQTFLLRTSVLERMCASLCEAVLDSPASSGQQTLEYLERTNLFIVPLDNERLWYRYHHLFAELLRQRLQRSLTSGGGEAGPSVEELHRRASRWYEDNGLEIEAFQHAAAGNDVERCESLIDAKGLNLHFRGVAAIRDWLESLPREVLDARPGLCVRYASALLAEGQTAGVEEKLRAAEAALADEHASAGSSDRRRALNERISAIRATLALTEHREETMLMKSRRALEPPDDLLSLPRLRAKWTMAMADHFQDEGPGLDGADASVASGAGAPGNLVHACLATIAQGQMQESENRLHEAADSYERVLEMIGDQSLPNAAEAHLGVARIDYAWNDLEGAERQAQAGLQLAQQYDPMSDKVIAGEVILARVKLAQGDVPAASELIEQARKCAVENNFLHRMFEIVGVQVLVLLRQGDLAAAAELAQTNPLPFTKVRVFIAQRDASAALAILEPLAPQVKARNWQDELLRILILQAAALQVQGDTNEAVQVLSEALDLAEPGGFIRFFMDEGAPMAELLSEAATRGIKPEYVGKLLAAFRAEAQKKEGKPGVPAAAGLIEALSERELEVLRLIAQGLSNSEISARLFLALSTVKGHNRIIFGKLQAKSRTEAVARARELGLI